MLSSAALLVGLVITQVGSDPDAAPTPTEALRTESLPSESLPLAPSPNAPSPNTPGSQGPDGAEEIAPLEQRASVSRHVRGLPAWGWNNPADGWYPSTRKMEPYLMPHFGRIVKPYYSPRHWWCSPGDMVQHLAYYPTLHSYYYARPYHPMQLPHHAGVADSHGTDPRNPYDNRIFEKVYASLKEEKALRGDVDTSEGVENGEGEELVAPPEQ